MQVDGIKTAHAVISDTCRSNKGEDQVIDEALEVLRAAYMKTFPSWARGKGAEFHVVLTVDYPALQKREGR